MLEVCDVVTVYGKVQALWDVCIEVHENEIVALLGSNGAGKTTLLNTITVRHCGVLW
jgi:branched-chain amino acid transport system ATP-binding protein